LSLFFDTRFGATRGMGSRHYTAVLRAVSSRRPLSQALAPAPAPRATA
jgi:hypothetical protein